MKTCIKNAYPGVIAQLQSIPQFQALNAVARDNIIAMESELRRFLNSLHTEPLRNLGTAFMASEYYPNFCLAPAAQRYHHNHSGGLLEHSLGTARIVLQIAELHQEIDRDLILTGALLHDIGKVREMEENESIIYTDEGKLLGHIILGIDMLERLMEGIEVTRVTRNKLLHMIASHHGHYEWQSPKKPKFLEAKVLHLADMMDAEIWKFKAAQALGEGSAWSPYMRSIGSEVYLEK
ncbi:MAG: HD domain-containing protein [Syntrophomonadaceae bacterium]|nr:HD domain-containing protein [Syntrophomonadaceae bacterium]